MSRQKYKHKARKKKETKRELNSRGTKNDIETLSEEFSFFFVVWEKVKKKQVKIKIQQIKSTAAKTNAHTHNNEKKKQRKTMRKESVCTYMYG